MTPLDHETPGHRRRTITDAEPSPHLAHVALPELRAYRKRLTHEEERISYWRRLAHARIDVLEAEARTDGTLSIEDLVRALGDTGSGQVRKALLSVKAADPLPDLPALEDMWTAEPDVHDPEQVADSVGQLRAAAAQLTDYRRALHERIDEATGELILRYRAEPAAALQAIPRG